MPIQRLLTILAFVLASLALLLIPGPSVLYIVTQSTIQGRRGGLASVAGIEMGGLTHAIAAALGLSAILLASTFAFDIVKYVGAGYLIFLGVRTILSKRKKGVSGTSGKAVAKPASRLFLQGYLVDLLNPKVALFFYAFLPQFVVPSQGSIIEQTLLLGGMYVAIAFCTDTMYALTSSAAGKIISSRAGPIFKAQKYVTGSIYLALGVVAATAPAHTQASS